MPKIEIQFKCKKCKNVYPADVSYARKIDDLDLDEHQSRCPFCGEWNCAAPASVGQAVKDAKAK